MIEMTTIELESSDLNHSFKLNFSLRFRKIKYELTQLFYILGGWTLKLTLASYCLKMQCDCCNNFQFHSQRTKRLSLHMQL